MRDAWRLRVIGRAMTAAKGREASSAPTLTCPGHSTASVSAIAFNHHSG
jgi:hypothetical protein